MNVFAKKSVVLTSVVLLVCVGFLIAGDQCNKKAEKCNKAKVTNVANVEKAKDCQKPCSKTEKAASGKECTKSENIHFTAASDKAAEECPSKCSKTKATLTASSDGDCKKSCDKPKATLTADASRSAKSSCSKAGNIHNTANKTCPVKARNMFLNVATSEKFCHKTAVKLLVTMSQLPPEHMHTAINAYVAHLKNNGLTDEAKSLTAAMENCPMKKAASSPQYQQVSNEGSTCSGKAKATLTASDEKSCNKPCSSRMKTANKSECSKPCDDAGKSTEIKTADKNDQIEPVSMAK